MATREEWAWAAGIFEGEGCVHVRTEGRDDRVYPVFSVRLTDRDVLERFVAIVEVGNVNGPYDQGAGRKPAFAWSVAGWSRFDHLVPRFAPWLGERRMAKIAEIATRRPTDPGDMGIANREKTHCPHGHEYTPENTARDSRGHRYCRRCSREWSRRSQKRRRQREHAHV